MRVAYGKSTLTPVSPVSTPVSGSAVCPSACRTAIVGGVGGVCECSALAQEALITISHGSFAVLSNEAVSL